MFETLGRFLNCYRLQYSKYQNVKVNLPRPASSFDPKLSTPHAFLAFSLPQPLCNDEYEVKGGLYTEETYDMFPNLDMKRKFGNVRRFQVVQLNQDKSVHVRREKSRKRPKIFRISSLTSWYPKLPTKSGSPSYSLFLFLPFLKVFLLSLS